MTLSLIENRKFLFFLLSAWKISSFLLEFPDDHNLKKASILAMRDVKVYIYEAQILGALKSKKCERHFENERRLPQLLRRYVATKDPSKADFFLINHDLTCTLTQRSIRKSRAKAIEIIDSYFKATIMNVVHNFPFYNRSGGHDHLFFFAIDKGRCHFLANRFPIQRSWFQYLDNMTFIGNFGFSGVSVTFQPIRHGRNCWRELKPTTLTQIKSQNCLRSNGNQDIVVPQLHDWRPPSPAHSDAAPATWDGLGARQQLLQLRSLTSYFRGSWKCGGVSSVEARTVLFNTSLSPRSTALQFHFDLTNNTNRRTMRGSEQHQHQSIGDAYFGLCPGGSAPWSVRLYDAIYHDVVPVILADRIVLPFERFLDWTAFTVKVQSEPVSVPVDENRRRHIAMFEKMHEYAQQHRKAVLSDVVRRTRGHLIQKESDGGGGDGGATVNLSQNASVKASYLHRKQMALGRAKEWLHWNNNNSNNTSQTGGVFRLFVLELWCRSTKTKSSQSMSSMTTRTKKEEICGNPVSRLANMTYCFELLEHFKNCRLQDSMITNNLFALIAGVYVTTLSTA
eukprot:gene8740-18061_t